MTRTETVRDVAFKEGRSGTLCFVTVDHAVATDRGVAIRERQDIVYREAAAAQTGTAVDPERDDPAAYHAVWEVSATPTLLFRYSAMTFNGHRFHYDQPYATQVEGYADLVVHGPMQATLLMNLAATLLGRVPRRFRVSRRVADDGQPDLPGLRPGGGGRFRGRDPRRGAPCLHAGAGRGIGTVPRHRGLREVDGNARFRCER